ncbi:MAG: response regulator [Oculatellaceae cyanobacterium Prado106]|jgi:DNA-binding response OmpR family regulator|nr:response regulator [Oculatellaceae cyanobacterium Prado106]
MHRILIAEDEARIAAFIEKGLRKHGYDTETVTNGLDAIAKATTEDFALLLLDIGLPGKDGWQVLQELRQFTQKLPVIVVTARDGESDRQESFKRGANDYLGKPFRFNDLLEKVNQQLPP